MAKFIKWVVVVIVMLVLSAIVGAALFGGALVKQGINRLGPSIMGVPVSVDDSRVSLVQGAIRLEGLRVGNPEGFKTERLFEVEAIDVEIDLSSLASDTVVIRRVHIEAPQITYEQGLRQSNLGALVAGMGSESPSPDAGSTGTKSDGKRVVIEDLLIANGKVNLSVTGAMGLSAPVSLATVRMQNVGGEDGSRGLGVRDVVKMVLDTVLRSVMNAVGGVGGLAADGVKAMGEGAAQAGQAAMDGLQAAGAGASEGLTIVGDGARQVGGAAVEGVKSAADSVTQRLGGLMGRGKTNATTEASP